MVLLSLATAVNTHRSYFPVFDIGNWYLRHGRPNRSI